MAVASRGTSTRGSAALAGIRLLAESDGLELQATDESLGLRIRVDAKVERGGEALVPGRLLADLSRTAARDEITLEHDATRHTLTFSSGSSHFELRTLPAEDFPTLPERDAGTEIELPAALFAATLARVARAASRDETRPQLGGVLVKAEGDVLRMVATDSYRLSLKTTKLEKPAGASLELNVPARTLQELTRVAAAAEEDAPIVIASHDDKQVVFRVGDVQLSSRLLQGRYPNYEQVFPEAFEHELRLPVEELLEVVRRVSLLAQKNQPLQLAFKEGELEISARTADVGEARDALPAPYKGEPLTIGFNAEFFRDGLESAGGEEILLRVTNALRPGLIEADDFRYLIMPIRLST